jgi:hypothetical protein
MPLLACVSQAWTMVLAAADPSRTIVVSLCHRPVLPVIAVEIRPLRAVGSQYFHAILQAADPLFEPTQVFRGPIEYLLAREAELFHRVDMLVFPGGRFGR